MALNRRELCRLVYLILNELKFVAVITAQKSSYGTIDNKWFLRLGLAKLPFWEYPERY